MNIKKKLVIDLDIEATSSSGLSGDKLLAAVEKDLKRTLEQRMLYISGDVGCYNGGNFFGYKFKADKFVIRDSE